MKWMGILVCVICLCSPVFPQGAEADAESSLPPDSPDVILPEIGMTIGFDYGLFWGRSFDGIQNARTYLTSPAVNFHLHSVRPGRAVGYFAHFSLLGTPNMRAMNGERPEYSRYYGRQTGYLFGPLLRHELNQKSTLFYGAGLNIFATRENHAQYMSLTNREEYFTSYAGDFGIGANIMLRYKPCRGLHLLTGCIVTYDFLSFGWIVSTNPALSNSPGRNKDFSRFGLRPYISIGIGI